MKIATAADFNGTRWTTSALMLQVPSSLSYLLPAGAVMRLFKRHNGTQGVNVTSGPSTLDIAASRTGDRIWLHVASLDYERSTEATLAVEGMAVRGGRVFEIAPEDPRQSINETNPEVFKPKEQILPRSDVIKWRFPARSVSAVELEIRMA